LLGLKVFINTHSPSRLASGLPALATRFARIYKTGSFEVTRPHGKNGPSPDEMFESRTPVTADERKTFIETVERMENEAYLDASRQGLWPDGTKDPDARIEAKIQRESIAAALVALGYLLVRRRRITPPVFSKKWEIFTR
jgi:hypothetical protein